MGVFLLEAGEDLREKIGTHHRGDAYLDRSLLQLLVVVDFENGVLDVAQGELDAVEEDSAFGR